MGKFTSLDWKEVKKLIDSKELEIIGGNYGQINNQGEFTINSTRDKVFKRRHTARNVMYDLIAWIKP